MLPSRGRSTPVGKKKEEEEAAVSSEQENNKALARRFLEATARADLDAMDQMMAPEFADCSLMPGQEPDREGSCTQRRTAGACASWATWSRRYGVSSAPAGRRSAQTSPLNVRRIGGVTMAGNPAFESVPMTQEPHRNRDSKSSAAHFFCHAKYTHVSQTLWRGLVCVPELCFSHGWRGYRRGLSHPARLRCLHVQNHRQRRRHDQHHPDSAGRDHRHQGGADKANGHKDDGTGTDAARGVLAQPQGAEGQLRDRQQGPEVGPV